MAVIYEAIEALGISCFPHAAYFTCIHMLVNMDGWIPEKVSDCTDILDAQAVMCLLFIARISCRIRDVTQ